MMRYEYEVYEHEEEYDIRYIFKPLFVYTSIENSQYEFTHKPVNSILNV